MNKTHDFRHITPCGECCEGCEKKSAGQCHGCLESDGHCEEWAQSGQCPTYACAKERRVPFCGVCSEFPCDHLPMMKWRPNCVHELTELAEQYRIQHGGTRHGHESNQGECHPLGTRPRGQR